MAADTCGAAGDARRLCHTPLFGLSWKGTRFRTFPFQIIQTPRQIAILYLYAHAMVHAQHGEQKGTGTIGAQGVAFRLPFVLYG